MASSPPSPSTSDDESSEEDSPTIPEPDVAGDDTGTAGESQGDTAEEVQVDDGADEESEAATAAKSGVGQKESEDDEAVAETTANDTPKDKDGEDGEGETSEVGIDEDNAVDEQDGVGKDGRVDQVDAETKDEDVKKEGGSMAEEPNDKEDLEPAVATTSDDKDDTVSDDEDDVTETKADDDTTLMPPPSESQTVETANAVRADESLRSSTPAPAPAPAPAPRTKTHEAPQHVTRPTGSKTWLSGAIATIGNIPTAVAKRTITPVGTLSVHSGHSSVMTSASSDHNSTARSVDSTGSASTERAQNRRPGKRKSKTKKKRIDPDTLAKYTNQVTSLLEEHFGAIKDDEATFEDMGLTSAKAIELNTQVAKSLGVTMPHDYLYEFCATPAIFKTYVVSRMSQDESFETVPRRPVVERKMHPKYKLRWGTMGIYQAVLAVVILLLCTLSLLPCWYLFDALWKVDMLSLLVPIYMVSATAVLVVTKWVVVGHYRAKKISAPSLLYLQFWFVDRLVAIWECYVGRFLLDTPWLCGVYMLLGANISLSCNLKGFIREFDLVTIEPYATLDYPCLQARSFQSWDVMERGPTMIFRSITIGTKSYVRGFLSPGVRVGRKAHVAKLSVVPEGSVIPEKTLAAGNPAVLAGSAPKHTYYGWGLFSLLKTIFMYFDLWLFFLLAKMAALVTKAVLGGGNGTNDLNIWAFLCFLFVYAISMLVSSVLVKWLLIGRRNPGPAREYVWQAFADWAADYHFSLAILLYRIVASQSRLSNLLLMLHGMSLDFASKVNIACFPPSKVDMICMRRSFVANCTFDVRKNGEFRKTIIEDSTIGSGSHIAPGMSLCRAVVPPLSFVGEDVDKKGMKHMSHLVNSWRLYFHEIVNLYLHCVFIAVFYVTLLPAYKYWMLFYEAGINGGHFWIVSVGVITILTYTWALVLLVLQAIALCGVSEKRPYPWSMPFYNVYQSFLDTFQEYSLAWHVLYGTQLLNDCIRLLGANVHGRALLFARSFADFPLLTIGDKAVVDGARVSGNVTLYDFVELAPSYTSGIVYDGSVIMGNGLGIKQRIGPFRAIVQSSEELRMPEPGYSERRLTHTPEVTMV
ncbi:expressed unknown protein [Seminavis robusta]|uniref:Carrier domain-containing protein n=1 Tax=Seminavis robusta TaxID=568900 RepID=A0A9N8DJL0_9STRA|nr:expressed unknown protein [Seminavis robusta]|eukprot:Sro94_g049100.1 n/a (1091) ;mRNA; f:102549-105995